MSHRVIRIVALLALTLTLLAGCAVTQTPAAQPTTAPTTAPAAAPTAAPTTAPAAAPTTAPTTAPTVAPTQAAAAEELILATTTSTADSGLLDVILPVFEEENNATVSVIAVGTGQALKLGEDGNADVLLVHARSQEDAFMAAGHGVRREDVMYNDFILVGPAEDPAGVAGKATAAEAFGAIAEAEATFVSRGDNSGTHTKELSVWKAAGVEPAGDWYVAAGQGMGDVLIMANEQQAYTLSDRATYLAMQDELESEILFEGDPVLFNPYGVIAVNPNKGAHIKADLANTFIDWIISLPTQELISEFGVEEFGAPLFVPDSQTWRDEMGEQSSTGGAPALTVSGKVAAPLAWTLGELQAMDSMEVAYTNKKGETTNFTGVSFAALLEGCSLDAAAKTLTLVANDGYTTDLALADVQACTDCIIATSDPEGLRSVMPSMEGSANVKGLVELQVN